MDSHGGEDDASGPSTAEQFAAMWRDSRKYGIWLHLITQSSVLIPAGILPSCNNLLVGQLKNPRDRDLLIAAFACSEKGFVDEAWRFLARLPVGHMVAKLGYSRASTAVEPVLVEPLMLPFTELGDEGL